MGDMQVNLLISVYVSNTDSLLVYTKGGIIYTFRNILAMFLLNVIINYEQSGRNELQFANRSHRSCELICFRFLCRSTLSVARPHQSDIISSTVIYMLPSTNYCGPHVPTLKVVGQ